MAVRVTTDQKAGVRPLRARQATGPLPILRQASLLPTPPISLSEQLVNGIGGLLAKARENMKVFVVTPISACPSTSMIARARTHLRVWRWVSPG